MTPTKQQIWAEVVRTDEVAPMIWELVLRAPVIASAAKPGQFVHLRVRDALDPLLRRPLSVGDCNGDTLTLLYRVVGHGTELLTHIVPGELLDIIGPLGNPFTLHADRSAVFVSGGLGIAVFPLLAKQLMNAGCHDIHLLCGARTGDELAWADKLEQMGVTVHLATDDCSMGHHGVCTDLLLDAMSACKKIPAIYACGPEPMFRSILQIVTDETVPVQLSYEQRMGCGIGACMACAVQTTDGYRRACMEGPVLDGGLFR